MTSYKIAGIATIAFVCIACCFRAYFVYWVILPKYKGELSTVLDENWLEYAMSMSDIFKFELVVWPSWVIFLALLLLVKKKD